MKISEMVQTLLEIQKRCGDLPCQVFYGDELVSADFQLVHNGDGKTITAVVICDHESAFELGNE